MDTSMLDTLALIAPDLMEDMELRALVLERVAALGPIGRRALAMRLHLQEREVRSAADALRTAQCMTQSAAGMELTAHGQSLVEAARVVSRRRRSLAAMETHLARKLGVERVCVVRGDADRDEHVIRELGRAAAGQIRFLLQDAQVLAVAGGQAMAETADALGAAAPMDVTVVPAEGMSGGVRTQANTVAETMAARLGGRCRLLYLPEGISAQAAAELSELPQVREALELLRHADVLLYSVGCAQEVTARRAVSPVQRDMLLAGGAAGEALGFYFNVYGRLIGGTSPAVNPETLGRANACALLGGGASKAAAIAGVCRHHPHKLLVIDEGAGARLEELV